jgi:hypothetical protein
MVALLRQTMRKSPPLMKYFAFLLLAIAAGANAAEHRHLSSKSHGSVKDSFQGPDRTITWLPWQKRPEFSVRTGDRYLGHEQWEHYLGFEEHPSSAKEIKLSKIHLASEFVPDVFIRPGSRYAIVKVTNSSMTAHKGRWSWEAQEMHTEAIFHIYALENH